MTRAKVLAFRASHKYGIVVRRDSFRPHMPSLGVSSLDLKAAERRPPFLWDGRGRPRRCSADPSRWNRRERKAFSPRRRLTREPMRLAHNADTSCTNFAPPVLPVSRASCACYLPDKRLLSSCYSPCYFALAARQGFFGTGWKQRFFRGEVGPN